MGERAVADSMQMSSFIFNQSVEEKVLTFLTGKVMLLTDFLPLHVLDPSK